MIFRKKCGILALTLWTLILHISALDDMYNEPGISNSELIDEINAEYGDDYYGDFADEEWEYATPDEALAELIDANDPIMQNVLLELNNLAAAIDQINVEQSDYDDKFGNMSEAEKMMQGRMMGTSVEQMKNDLNERQEMLVLQQESLKRFTELKQLVAWMQPKDKRISRYCFYGCWCLPEGAHSFVAGEGRPVDESDKACQKLWFCYTCAKKEFRGVFEGRWKECKPEKTRYTFKLKFKRGQKNNYELRDILCRDRWTKHGRMNTLQEWKANCAKAVCECDRGLAKNLYRSYKTWDKSRHRIWSQKVVKCKQLDDCKLLPEGFEKDACMKRGCLFIVKHRCLQGGDGGNELEHDKVCCGRYEHDGGRMEMRNMQGLRDCCNRDEGKGFRQKLPWAGVWYNTITHCCIDGQTWNSGSGKCGA